MLACPHCQKETVTSHPEGIAELHCVECGPIGAFNRLPLLVVAGTSATGKSSLVAGLRERLPGVAVFDKDLLPHFIPRPERLHHGSHIEKLNDWMRIAYGLAQCGIPTLLCGWLDHDELQSCADRGLVGEIHLLVLDLSDEAIEERIKQRQEWRLLKGVQMAVRGSLSKAQLLRDQAA